MASATHDFRLTENPIPAWHAYFSEAERQRMRAEDAQAWKTVSLVLTTVVSLGLVAMVATVIWVLI